jgi:hypothetical protein
LESDVIFDRIKLWQPNIVIIDLELGVDLVSKIIDKLVDPSTGVMVILNSEEDLHSLNISINSVISRNIQPEELLNKISKLT